MLIFGQGPHFKRVLLPHEKQIVWYYLYDWQDQEHYLLRLSNSDRKDLYLLDVANQKAWFVQRVEHFPDQIVGDNMIYCAGSVKSNCDFYWQRLAFLPGGDDIDLTVLEETLPEW